MGRDGARPSGIMNFGAPNWLWTLAILPLLVFLYARAERRSAIKLREFVSPRLLPQLAGNVDRVQRAMHTVHAEAADVDEDELPTGVDGCGVVTFALPLERMAYAFSRFEQLDGGARVAKAMRAYPDLIRGPKASDEAPAALASAMRERGERGWGPRA